MGGLRIIVSIAVTLAALGSSRASGSSSIHRLILSRGNNVADLGRRRGAHTYVDFIRDGIRGRWRSAHVKSWIELELFGFGLSYWASI